MHKLAAIALLCPALVFANPSATATNKGQTVELVWKHDDGGDWHVVFSMPVDHACSDTKVKSTYDNLSISMCRDGGEEQAPKVTFHLERLHHADKKHATQELRTTLALARGQATTLGHFDVADQKDEVVAWLR